MKTFKEFLLEDYFIQDRETKKQVSGPHDSMVKAFAAQDPKKHRIVNDKGEPVDVGSNHHGSGGYY